LGEKEMVSRNTGAKHISYGILNYNTVAKLQTYGKYGVYTTIETDKLKKLITEFNSFILLIKIEEL